MTQLVNNVRHRSLSSWRDAGRDERMYVRTREVSGFCSPTKRYIHTHTYRYTHTHTLYKVNNRGDPVVLSSGARTTLGDKSFAREHSL